MNRRNFSKQISTGLFLTGISPSLTVLSSNTPMPKKCIKVNRLKKGDTIGLIAPGSSVTKEKLNKAVSNLESLGFQAHFTKNILAQNGFLAGTDQQRLNDLHQMYSDSKINGIWCIRGGYGCGRLLPKIDYKLIQKNPKALIGYSDVTALLQAVYLKTGIVGFHGPLAVSELTDYTRNHFKAVLMNPNTSFTISVSKENNENANAVFKTKVIRPGIAKGQIVGGNLSLIAALTGTKYQWKIKNKIIFLEDVGEKPYRIDRMLTQLLQSCDLNKAAGIALGVFWDCEKKEGDRSLTLMETLEDRLGHLNIPVIYGLSFGHIDNHCTLPVGLEASLDTSEQTITLLEPAVL